MLLDSSNRVFFVWHVLWSRYCCQHASTSGAVFTAALWRVTPCHAVNLCQRCSSKHGNEMRPTARTWKSMPSTPQCLFTLLALLAVLFTLLALLAVLFVAHALQLLPFSQQFSSSAALAILATLQLWYTWPPLTITEETAVCVPSPYTLAQAYSRLMAVAAICVLTFKRCLNTR